MGNIITIFVHKILKYCFDSYLRIKTVINFLMEELRNKNYL